MWPSHNKTTLCVGSDHPLPGGEQRRGVAVRPATSLARRAQAHCHLAGPTDRAGQPCTHQLTCQVTHADDPSLHGVVLCDRHGAVHDFIDRPKACGNTQTLPSPSLSPFDPFLAVTRTQRYLGSMVSAGICIFSREVFGRTEVTPMRSFRRPSNRIIARTRFSASKRAV